MDEVLVPLVGTHLVAHCLTVRGRARLVAGPTGAFVLAVAGDSSDADAAGLGRLAGGLRERLVEHLGWAPFVEPLMVAVDGCAADAGTTAGRGVTVVPVGFLARVLREGLTVMGTRRLAQVGVLIDGGSLRPWQAGIPGSGSIGACTHPTATIA
jgi:hypothetical protein